jgi:hypothetical protein
MHRYFSIHMGVYISRFMGVFICVFMGVLAISTLPVPAEPSGTPKSSGKGPPGASAQPPQKPGLNIELRDGIYWIGPTKSAPIQNNQPKTDKGKGSWIPNPPAPQLARTASAGDWSIIVSAARGNDAQPVPLPAQATPVPANRFVIQFKPNVSKQQRDALLARYGLTVQRELPAINSVVATRPDPANEPPAKTLAEVFNPPIIQKLRRENIVQNATVDTGAAPRTIPRPVDVNFKSLNGAVYHWSWGSSMPTSAPSGAATSMQPDLLDGNWGLKALRLPPVWTIIKRYREIKPDSARPKLAVIDTNFSNHSDLAINLLPSPNQDGSEAPISTASIGPPCERAHGNHVAGIIGAKFGNGAGIDGVIPDGIVDAVPVASIKLDPSQIDMTDAMTPEGLAEKAALLTGFYSDIITAIQEYVPVERAKGSNLRVVNISMGVNVWRLVEWGADPNEVKVAVRDTLKNQAQIMAGFMKKYENSILFVVAAGNDSDKFPKPLEAKWSSSFAWLARSERGDLDRAYIRPKNILIVEAVDRHGQRAEFSNINGHIAAPGVDILSTLDESEDGYYVCDGTSQAAPFAAGVAALMFELSPGKKPAEIIDIMVKSATPRAPGSLGAPRLDALEAVLRLSPFADSRNENLVRLADLNRDGKVDILDMREFARQLAILNDNRMKGTPFKEDLNGDTVVDGNECHWPLIDLNGSGSGSLIQTDARMVLGERRNDLAVLQLAWTDKNKDSAGAIKETGLDQALRLADLSNVRLSPQACR